MEVMMSRTGTRSHDDVDLRPLEGEAAEIDDLDRRAGVADEEEEQEVEAQQVPTPSAVVDEADEETGPEELGGALPELLDSYLREIGHTPLLKPEQEVDLAKRVEQGDRAAANAMA